MKRRRPRWFSVAAPFLGAVLAWVVLAVTNRHPDFIATFVGSSVQWLLTMSCMAGLIGAGVHLGALWASVTRFAGAARTAALALAIGGASLVLFAQTYSATSESDAPGYVGLACAVSVPVTAVAATIAAIGTSTASAPGSERQPSSSGPR